MEEIKMRVEHISKSFPGVKALTDIDFAVRKGTVHALCGENGAGKSTLMKIINGIYKADAGQIYIDEKSVEIKNPMQARDHGISMIAQELNYIPDLTVEENLFLGRLPVNKLGKIDWRKVRRETKKFLAEQNLPYSPTQTLRTLTVSDIQMLEIIKAITNNAQIIIMDEPTSSISQKEVALLFDKIETLRNNGVSIVYISHKMEELFAIADDITVIRDGSVVNTHAVKDLLPENATAADVEAATNIIISEMVGRKLDNVYPKEEVPIGEVAIEVEHFCKKNIFEDINFYARKGEIVGFAGLVGAGRTETMRAVYGLDPHDSGNVKVHGEQVVVKDPKNSINNGVIMLSEDRREYGLIPVRSVMENASIANLKSYIYGGYTHHAKEREEVSKYFEKMNVKTPSLDTPISSLSGGNAQKVLLSRWMLCQPDVMILDEPTRGIDVGAKFEIYKLMTEIVKENKAIIMVSSEMAELIGMCDRIYVMCQGRIAGCLSREEFSQERIMLWATGLAESKKEGKMNE